MRVNQRICGIFQGVRGVPTEIAYPAEPGDLHFLEFRRTVCSSYPQQLATAAMLDRPEAIRAFQEPMKAHVRERLDALHAGFMAPLANGKLKEKLDCIRFRANMLKHEAARIAGSPGVNPTRPTACPLARPEPVFAGPNLTERYDNLTLKNREKIETLVG